MKKKKGKFLSIVLSFVLMFSSLVIPKSEIKASAADEIIEKALQWAVDIANDNSHGYTLDTTKMWGPDYNCATLVISALKYAGFDTGDAFWTKNMVENLTKCGFTWISWSDLGGKENLQRGDILLNIEHHTEFCLSSTQLVGANNDRGYSQTGDQTGTEIYIKSYWWYPWDGILRYNGTYVPPEPDRELGIDYPRPSGSPYLQTGSKGNYVGWLQVALNRAINAGLTIDCDFGTATYNAVRAFQSTYGLEVDGVVGSDTINKLVSVLLDMMKPKTCIVSFNANGGSCGTGSKTVTIGNTYGDLPSASRIGYAFAGWFTEASGGSQVTASTSVIRSENHTLYAHWNVNSYTISFNGNGGTPNQNSKSVAYDSTYGDLPSATRTGYTLVGWFTESGGGNQISASTSMTRAENHTLYAHWSANPVIVKLNPNSGTVSSETIQLYYDGKYAGLPEATRTGYNFNGWYTSADGGTQVDANTVVNQTSEHTLYAHWSKDKFLITFDAKGGTAEAVSKLVSYDNSYGVLPNAEKSGYTFDGWYFDEQYTTQLTPDTKVQITGNQTFYAKWSLKQYIVTFDANGGSVEAQSKKVTYGKIYGVLPTPENNRYDFLGWFTADGIEITSSGVVELDSDVTVYAKWLISGDINADNIADVKDIVILQKYLIGKRSLSETEFYVADLNHDGIVNIYDMIYAKRILIGK